MQSTDFTSNKPYLFRAIYEWLLDNNATPYILVDTTKSHVEVPQEHIKDNQIVLNVNPSAIQNWHVDNQAISFSARFSGKARNLYVPMNALMAVYAQENGLGMAFPPQDEDDEVGVDLDKSTQIEEASDSSGDDLPPKKGSHLKVVK